VKTAREGITAPPRINANTRIEWPIRNIVVFATNTPFIKRPGK
jgi:hypothetical protein